MSSTARLCLTAVVCATAAWVPPATAQETVPVVVFRCGGGVHAGEASGVVTLPQDEIFCPLVADPKQPRSFVGLQWGEFPSLENPADGESITIGAVGLGDRFGLVRWGGRSPGDGFMLSVSGAILAQFDLTSASFDLINADYLVGVPLTWRRGTTTARLRIYHQSSHLGDEYLLRDDEIQRENLSFESAELILSQEAGPLRVYAGGEHLFRREPETVDRLVAHAGVELHTGTAGPVGLVAGVDAKMSQQQEWSPAWSARAGLRIAPRSRGGHPVRHVLLLAEYYSGPAPYGQFFQEDVHWGGIGLHLMH